MSEGAVRVRRATAGDLQAVVEVAAAALKWAPGEPHGDLFRWKHIENAFGSSPIWLAEVDGRLAGFRSFMRWDLVDEEGRVRRAVRAVDTATHPDSQRRGIFSTLTMAGVEALRAEGVDLVFNTPNDQSRPGYLKMGWRDVGRVPIAARPSGASGLVRMLRARVPADKWSRPTDVGEAAAQALADPRIEELLRSQPIQPGLATRWTVDALRWRHGFAPLHYRAWAPDGVARGVVLFRLRSRGPAIEGTVSTVLVPDGKPQRRRELLSSLGRAVEADYLLVARDA